MWVGDRECCIGHHYLLARTAQWARLWYLQLRKPKINWDALCNLVPFVKFQKRKKQPWRSVTFSKVAKSNTPPWVIFTFLKFFKWCQIVQRINFYCHITQRFTSKELEICTLGAMPNQYHRSPIILCPD